MFDICLLTFKMFDSKITELPNFPCLQSFLLLLLHLVLMSCF